MGETGDPTVLFACFDTARGKRGSHLAVVSDGHRISYAQMGIAVAAARRAIDGAVAMGQPVGIHAGTPADAVIGVLAAWASGRAAQVSPSPGGASDALAVVHVTGGSATVAGSPRSGNSPSTLDGAALLIDTAGTTGGPKTVVHTASSLLRCLLGTVSLQAELLGQPIPDVAAPIDELLSHIDGLTEGALGLRFFSGLPMSTMAGTTLLVRTLLVGDTLVARSRFAAPDVLRDVTAHDVSSLSVAPFQAQHLARHARLEDVRDNPLVTVGVGGGPATPALLEELEATLRVVTLRGYGSTELGGPAVSGRYGDPDESRWSTVGRPVPGVEVRVGDPRRDPGAGTAEGGLWCRAPAMAAGYLDEPFDLREGWFGTKDVARRDAQGFINVIARQSDVILRGGRNIDPLEIEAVVEGVDGIGGAAAVGEPSRVVGEENVVVYVEPLSGRNVDRAAVRSRCLAQLPIHMQPRRIVFINELPRASDGGLRRVDLRESAVE